MGGAKTLKVTLEDNIDSDEYTVTWKLYRGDKPGATLEDLTIVDNQVMTGNSSEFNPTSAEYDKIFKDAGEDNIEGRYYAIITNKLNGVTTTITGESATTAVPSPANMFVVTGD